MVPGYQTPSGKSVSAEVLIQSSDNYLVVFPIFWTKDYDLFSHLRIYGVYLNLLLKVHKKSKSNCLVKFIH